MKKWAQNFRRMLWQKKTGANFGCDACGSTPENQSNVPMVLDEWLYDSSHDSWGFTSCPNCGQKYLWHFHEHLDWSGAGDDRSWSYWRPLSSASYSTLSSAVEDARGDTGKLISLLEAWTFNGDALLTCFPERNCTWCVSRKGGCQDG